jgi:DNA-binding CsgD family transcriptional regulator
VFPEDYLRVVANSYRLTLRELEVFRLLVNADSLISLREMADMLSISLPSMHNRLTGIYKKFNITGEGPKKLTRLRQVVTAKYEIERINFHEEKLEGDGASRVVRSIEFPSEYWESGTSILSYFSRILSFKYPNNKIKVKIEQEGLLLRMIIETPSGERDEVEKTLEEYGMVVTGKIQPEIFLSDPFEAMALKNKLEIADLELRQTRKLLDFTRDHSNQRIESLEVQVDKLHCIIEKGLQSSDHVFGVIRKMTEQDKSTYNLSNAKFGGGFAAEGGFQVGGSLIDLSSASDLPNAAQQIHELLQQLQLQGISIQ